MLTRPQTNPQFDRGRSGGWEGGLRRPTGQVVFHWGGENDVERQLLIKKKKTKEYFGYRSGDRAHVSPLKRDAKKNPGPKLISVETGKT